MLHFQRSLRYYIDLVFQKAKADLRTEAARGYLGVLWWIIEPIMYMGAFYIVFAHIQQRGDKNYVTFLLSGLIAWKWFHSSIMVGSNSLIANANLMKQVYVPKILFPLTTIIVNTIKFLIIVFFFILFLQVVAGKASWSWLYLPVLIFVQLLLIIAATSFFSAIMPFFPDLRGILENILLMFFFVSGVFFDITTLPEKVKKYLSINPMAFLITSYRDALLHGRIPNWKGLFYVILFSFFVFCLAGWLFQKYDRVYPKITY